MDTDKWLTLDELAEYLKLSRTKLYRMAQKGEIPASKIGTQWRFNRKEIDDWVTSQRPDGASSQGTENGNDGKGA
jgi:excisionase family DNA binding protein